MRILVTGAHGFVGRHLSAALRARGHEVVATEHAARAGAHDEGALAVDVTVRSRSAARSISRGPDAVAHLAAQAFVPASLQDPAGTFAINAGGTLNVLEAARALGARRRGLRACWW